MSSRARIRMYRQGLGDCFLVTLSREPTPFHMVIDCGVILGTENPKEIMTRVVEDIHETTGGVIDVLAVTHEHWDHVSGFVQAEEIWGGFQIKKVWFAWTENPRDELAKKLGRQRAQAVAALGMAHKRLGAMPPASASHMAQVEELGELLGFFGAGKVTTRVALDAARKLGDVEYLYPGEAPIVLEDTAASVYVLGPPHDEKKIKKFNPSKAHPETYELGNQAQEKRGSSTTVPEAYGFGSMAMYLDNMEDALLSPDTPQLFPRAAIPLEVAQQMPFFRNHYYQPPPENEMVEHEWRTIDAAWLGSTADMALALNSATNNTSLAFAISLGDGDVLLFAADAQVGNWLSWQDVTWTKGRKTLSGADLLGRTVFYKVGHHGSHNATLKAHGLELMTKLKFAMLPVDHEMAKKKKWIHMPLPGLLSAFDEMGVKVIRIDESLPQGWRGVKETELYFDLSL